MKIEVLKPGAQTQAQDLGRYGYQGLGVPVSGVMDEWSHRLANLLAGNSGDEATLEIVLTGPTLRFEAATRIAICGADLSARLDGRRLRPDRAVDVPAGGVLEFGACEAGLRAYLAVRGGLAITPLMGSRSSYVRGGFGGFAGRALRKGDVLLAPDASGRPTPRGPGVRPILPSSVPREPRGQAVPLRVMPGEHWALFTPAAREALLQAEFRITAQSDRMGYRLEGPPLARSTPGELVSEAMSFGTIQVPNDGQPIVLMAERHGTGGYPKIAHVISVDLPRLAQLGPQQTLRFQAVTLETAQALYLQREQLLATLRDALL
ncbi:biotin-dependent carboxyltransferase family protein [Kinneretia asaccharophila]|uniref:Urea carboxylase n=1 Tax=Roseateles asaccharophilus TaxID=582607 RepID=A0A4V3CK55_9BURK|nr:biotin-dependent carboxyltransferase family protein [Roseateles asaccharophilus]MDN3544977.1 biotin-dependent carboxyltransferase family protein [Roseateles asaccharophilus]TDP12637.1 urea carboxylase [Roseateles asaccharophilus]